MCHGIGFNCVDGDGLIAPRIHVEVKTAVVVQNKVPNSVCTLNRESIVVPSAQEPRVFNGEEVAC